MESLKQEQIEKLKDSLNEKLKQEELKQKKEQEEKERIKQERKNLIFNIFQYTFSIPRYIMHSINRILVSVFYWIFRIVMLSFLFFIVQTNIF